MLSPLLGVVVAGAVMIILTVAAHRSQARRGPLAGWRRLTPRPVVVWVIGAAMIVTWGILTLLDRAFGFPPAQVRPAIVVAAVIGGVLALAVASSAARHSRR